MNKPEAPANVVIFNKTKGDYLEAISNINTSYGRVSTMNSGVHGLGSAIAGLTDMREHLEWIATEVARAESLRKQLVFMYEEGIDRLADQFQQTLWAYYAEVEAQKKAEVA
jgi:hypothetical protein